MRITRFAWACAGSTGAAANASPATITPMISHLSFIRSPSIGRIRPACGTLNRYAVRVTVVSSLASGARAGRGFYASARGGLGERGSPGRSVYPARRTGMHEWLTPFVGARLRQMATHQRRSDWSVRLAAPDPPDDADALPAQYARTRDPALRERIVRTYAPLIERTLLDFNYAGVPVDDLRQVGYVGLLTALGLFDPTRGAKVKTYAGHLVRGGGRPYLRDHPGTNRQPRWLRRLNRGIEEAVGRALSEEGRFPSLEDLAVELNIQEEGLRELLKMREAVRTVSLDAGEDEEQFA